MTIALSEQILPVHTEQGRLWVDARTLHAQLHVGRDFSTWIRSRLEEVEAVENQDFIVLDGSPISGSKWGGANRRDYWLVLDIAKEIAMLERNEYGKAIRRYFIEVERRYRERQAAALALPNFNDPVAAARAWADAKEREQQALVLAAENQEKAAGFDAFLDSSGLYSMRNAAKLLGTGERKLFEILRDGGVLMSAARAGAENHNVPYQKHIDAGHFKVKTSHSRDGEHVSRTPRVTPAGLEYLRRRFFPGVQLPLLLEDAGD
ncbi:prophage antirepressor (plasmid) [Deinococcus proteolyticus MRP]|uniref:Prophage antirepressor n=1 Tax=Deinococcus proteolyticus (strain ATCC 35074 / DSM 20540 / JCM 6276 / NBRC 101906 / NCIMB 13154 / VKM Ac-1939 / CCM 2703 / MRP) TaxID=693977 RepID=F0RRA3_DEIPM|nr:phage antirepressor KilAC domain-containing protein [Deinococcus proteolyticus]ADY27812.1 prophage antirepressor [Deinococcus proteolyticus MRP]